MRQFGFVGKMRLEAAQRLLPEAVSTWRSQWCFGHGAEAASPLVIEAEAVPDDVALATMYWLHVEAGDGCFWLGTRGASAWHRLVMGDHADDAPVDAVAEHLQHQARLGLANTLLSELQLATVDVLATGSLPVVPGAVCSPQILLMLRGAGEELFILLDALLFNSHLPTPEAKQPLVARSSAIGSARIKLRVTLPLSEVAVADLSGLQVGDILKAETPLTQAFHLMTDRDTPLAKGFLARTQTRLALQLADR